MQTGTDIFRETQERQRKEKSGEKRPSTGCNGQNKNQPYGGVTNDGLNCTSGRRDAKRDGINIFQLLTDRNRMAVVSVVHHNPGTTRPFVPVHFPLPGRRRE